MTVAEILISIFAEISNTQNYVCGGIWTYLMSAGVLKWMNSNQVCSPTLCKYFDILNHMGHYLLFTTTWIYKTQIYKTLNVQLLEYTNTTTKLHFHFSIFFIARSILIWLSWEFKFFAIFSLLLISGSFFF